MDQPTEFRGSARFARPGRLAWLVAPLGAGLLACGALLAVLAAPVPDAHASPFRAPAGTTHDYPSIDPPCKTTLQHCLDSSLPGDTILVLPGTYTESLTLSAAISLTGVSSATTTLHALPNQRVLTVTGAAINSSVVISGLTFAGGQAFGSFNSCPAGCGGGMLIEGNAQPRLENLTLRDNNAYLLGGGLFADLGSPLTLTGVLVLSNQAGGSGGGLASNDVLSVTGSLFWNNQSFGGGGIDSQGDLTLSDTQFISNTSVSSGGAVTGNKNAIVYGGLFQNNYCTQPSCSGGAMRVLNSLIVTGTQFLSNTSLYYGGGVEVENGSATLSGVLFRNNQCTHFDCSGGALSAGRALTLTNTQFLSNTSQAAGGAVYATGNAVLSGDVLQSNQCAASGCQGGGLYAFAGLTMTDTRVYSNTSLADGGGLYASSSIDLINNLFTGNRSQDGGGLFLFGGNGRLVNTLFSGNGASGHGAALYLGSTGHVSLLHTTIAGPSLGSLTAVYVAAGGVGLTNTLLAGYPIGIEQVGGSVTEDYSLFAGLPIALWGAITSGGHSITGSADFVNPAGGDFHLGSNSDAIDTGVNTGINFDIDGDPRPLGKGFDIGYDETSLAHLADLGLSLTDGQTIVQPGDALTYTLVVTNAGPNTASGAVLSDSLPASLTGASWTCLSSLGSSCPVSGSGNIHAAITIMPGGQVVVVLHATVADNARCSLTNAAQVSLPSSVEDTAPANNTATDLDVIPPICRLYLPLAKK